jgi:predicted metal-dependent phosphoesterase TrpH
VKEFLADLHIHTALSSCADDEMTPPAIVRAAIEAGLAMIAICDHNSALNTAATQRAADVFSTKAPVKDLSRTASGSGVPTGVDKPVEKICVLAGMEISTSEEVHVLGIFPDAESASRVSEEIRATLPNLSPRLAKSTRQAILDEQGRSVGMEKKMLSAASTFNLKQAVAMIHRHGGVAVASHADRPSFSISSQLGGFPADAGLDAIEIFGVPGRKALVESLEKSGLSTVASSDSHFLTEIGSRRTKLRMREASFAELSLALANRDGRETRRA